MRCIVNFATPKFYLFLRHCLKIGSQLVDRWGSSWDLWYTTPLHKKSTDRPDDPQLRNPLKQDGRFQQIFSDDAVHENVTWPRLLR